MPTNLHSELQSRFDLIVDFSHEYRDWGYMALPISGRFLRNQPDADALVARIKAVLPPDARLVVCDGAVLRMIPSASMWASDTYAVMFGSKEWPRVEEGAELPRLEPLFLADTVGQPAFDLRAIGGIPKGVGLVARVDKRTHRMVIRREEETEHEVVIRIEPLEIADASA